MKKCQTCSKVIEHDELCFCKWEKKGMTPIEIIEAWGAGKRLNYKIWGVTDAIIKIFAGPNCYTHSPSEEAIPDVTINCETFGFFRAFNLMRDGKVIGKKSTGSRYRLTSMKGLLQFKAGRGEPWLTFSGYPLDWPGSVDFYEVEE